MAFKPNEQWYGHIRWIVCDNMPKFGTCLHLVMENNVAKERFQLVSQKKPFFIFWMPKTRVFREAATKRDIPNGVIPCLSQSRPYFTDGRQKSCISDPRSYSRPFRQPSTDSGGTGWNLNHGCSIACPLFFLKIIFSFTGRHFIKESTTSLHDSTPSHGRPPRRNRPDFQNTVKNSKKIKKWETSASHHQMWPTN